jgi:hypothetical protein
MKKFVPVIFALSFFAVAVIPAQAKPSEYDLLVRHLRTKYKAKKINIPFIFLARMAVGIARPAGVKSFSITLFKDLKISRENLDIEMQSAMRNAFGPEWSPIFRARSQNGQQAYMYMREEGNSVRISLLTIDKEQAAIIRATFNPDKLVDFINNPRIMGIPIGDETQRGKDNEQPIQAPPPPPPPLVVPATMSQKPSR